MPAGTTLSAIYTALGTVVTRATGRNWWKKYGIQGQPTGVYATIYITSGEGMQNQVVEKPEYSVAQTGGEWLHQIPWGTTYLNCQVEFWRSSSSDAAQDAAIKLKQAMYLEARWSDLYMICSLSGGIHVTDISAIFRSDIEPRVRLEFKLIANISGTEPIYDVPLHDIHEQPFVISHGTADGDADDVETSVENTTEET